VGNTSVMEAVASVAPTLVTEYSPPQAAGLLVGFSLGWIALAN
jgi:hypothetical protein